MENLSNHLFMLLFIVSARELALWYPFPTDQTRIFFRWKMEKTRYVKEEMEESCLFPARVGIFPL